MSPKVINMVPRPSLRTIGTVAGILLLLGLVASNILVVRENEFRVIRNWSGIVDRIVDQAGPTLKIPFLQSDQSLSKAKRLYSGAQRDILTSDQKPIIVDHYGLWAITDPLKFVQNTQSVANAEQRIDAAIYSTVRGVLGQLKYGEIVAEGGAGRQNLSEQVTQLVNETLSKGEYGITVYDVRLKRTDLPEQNLQSVYARMKTDRNAIAADYLSQGDEEAIKLKAQTDREVAQMIAEATRQAKEIEAEGEAEAARIYNDAYGADPNFYELYRTLESYKTTLRGKPAIILPINSRYARLLLGE